MLTDTERQQCIERIAQLPGRVQALVTGLPAAQLTMPAPIHSSLQVLEGLHARWATWPRTLTGADWRRVGNHEETGQVALEDLLQLYATHSEEHLQQLQRVLAARQK